MGFLDALAGQLQAQRAANTLAAAYDASNPPPPGQQPPPQPQGLIAKLFGLGGDQSPGTPLQLAGAVAPPATSVTSPAPPAALAGGLVGQLMGPPSPPVAPNALAPASATQPSAAMSYAPSQSPSSPPPTPPQPSAASTPSFGSSGLPAIAALQGTPGGAAAASGLFSGVEKQFNLPAGYLAQTASIESGGDPNATSPTGAKGLFQFTKGTAAQYGLSDPTNVVASTYAAGKLAADNATTLTQALGRPPTAGELYLAHQQGAGTAAALLANPNQPAGQVLASIGVSPRNITVNGGDPNMPAGQFASLWTSKFGSGVGGAGAPPQNQGAAPNAIGGSGATPPLRGGSPYGALDTNAFGPQQGSQQLPTFASTPQGGLLSPATPWARTAPQVAQAPSAPADNGMAYAPDAPTTAATAQAAITAATGQPYGSVPLMIKGQMMTRQQAENAPEALDVDHTDYDAAAAKLGMTPNASATGAGGNSGSSASASSGGAPQVPSTSASALPALSSSSQASALSGQVLPPAQPVQPSQNVTATIRTLLSNPDTASLGAELWKSMLTRTPPAFQHIETSDGRVLVFNPATGGVTAAPGVQGSAAPTDAIKNYQFAKGQGYAGSFTAYQSDQQKADKAQLIDVPLANGQMQKVWSTPGQDPTQGVPVGQPYTKRPDTAISIDTKGESAEAAEAGKNAATRRGDMLAAADAAPDKIARLNLLGTVLDRTQTGPLAGAAGTVVNVANSLGIAPDAISALGLNPNQAVDNQVAQKLANELVMGSIGAKNGGFPASNFSVAERQFIEKTFPSISAQPGANQAVNDVLVAREQRNLQKADAWGAYKQQQKAASQPLSYEDFEGQWQQDHAGDNIFAPIQQKFVSGGYGPVGASAPQPNAVNQPQAAPQGGAPAAPPPVAGARQGRDGNFYVSDPRRPGKYLMVNP